MGDMTDAGSGQPGRVWAHVGQPLEIREFDVVVIGAGRMGAAVSLYLRQLAPAQSVLMVEEGGLPNEEGATILAPGVWSTLNIPEEERSRAQWTRQQLANALGDVQFREQPLIELGASPLPDGKETAGLAREFPQLGELVDLTELPYARLDRQAATFRPGSVALNAAQQAIRLGANLLLNTRVRLSPSGLLLERLTVTNTHQIVTHETVLVQAGRIVVAAGAAGPGLVEHGLGLHTRHGRAFQQYPRLNIPSTPQSPVLRVGGLTLRPQQGALTVVPDIHQRDPHGYVPVGGHLTGVPTGLRRELLEELVNHMDTVPVLGSEALHVGRSLSDVPGAWVALPGGSPLHLPRWEEVGPGTFLLLGGPQADTLGLWAARDLAREIASQAGETPPPTPA